jgi:lysophospholipase L1-like esterase
MAFAAQGGEDVRRAALLVLAAGAIAGCDAVPPPASPETTPPHAAAPQAAAAPQGPKVTANPLVSRGKPVVGSSLVKFARPEAVVDGVYNAFEGTWNAGTPTPSQPAWVAIDLGAGPRRVLVSWSSGGNYNYTDTEYGAPGAYRIETSADSTDGRNGTWNVAATNPHCTVHAQAHAIDFAGQRWVKMVVTEPPARSPNGVQLDEIEVFDVSGGVTDSWFFFGDSITAMAFNRTTPSHQPSFAALVHERHPRFFPAMVDGGVGGARLDDAVQHVDEWLALNPDMRFWAIGFGTNDAAGNVPDTAHFVQQLSTIVSKVKAAGHIPIVARIPYSSDGGHETLAKFNDAITDLATKNDLPAGPDLYGWFRAHPEQLRDGIHPTDDGVKAINRLWADAVASLYAP